MRKQSDQDLVRALQGGSEEAFLQLIKRYTNRVYALAIRYTKNPEDAEEVLQDVFVTLHRKIKGFEGKSAFSSWLFRVTVNSALMKLRKRRKDEEYTLDDPESNQVEANLNELSVQPEGERSILQEELRLSIQHAVKQLPQEYAAVFILRDVDQFTSQEVAEILQITIPAVKSRLHRARTMLRELIFESKVAVELDLTSEAGGF